MNKTLKFGLIFSGIYIIILTISYLVLFISNSVISILLLEISYFPFGSIINNYIAYVLNALLYFGIGTLVGFLIEKLRK
ncbi:MAG: hypothetical protein WC755_03140 [Candidatus Woesearchaeota archaeon]|jgi:uncharacterized membrane protein